ncbi:MAG: prepilin-type N-terminal cleavage/methylation domain-containing protein [Planctomycetaceae bacterium]
MHSNAINTIVSHRRPGRAFTLAELMVVMAIIVLVSAVVLPGINKIFTAGADMMALNLLTGQIDAARTTAMDKYKAVGVHCQMADTSLAANANLANRQFMTVVEHSLTGFTQTGGYKPQPLPGNYVLGSADEFRNGGVWVNAVANGFTSGDLTTFSIVFNAEGNLIKRTDTGEPIRFDGEDLLFKAGNQLWSMPPDEEGVSAVTVFDYVQAQLLTSDAAKFTAFMNESAQYLPIHMYTGLMYPRK